MLIIERRQFRIGKQFYILTGGLDAHHGCVRSVAHYARAHGTRRRRSCGAHGQV